MQFYSAGVFWSRLILSGVLDFQLSPIFWLGDLIEGARAKIKAAGQRHRDPSIEYQHLLAAMWLNTK
jgi:hypothetical protein